MLCRYCIWGSALLLSGMLAAGCRSAAVAPHPVARARSGAEPAKESSARVAKPHGTLDKVAQAHAHYAAGVVHEMNGELEPALEEYFKAATEDPENEWLVLEVSRRFMLNKQPEKALELLTRATARPDASGALYARLGVVYSQLGKADLALNAYRTAIQKSPETLAGYQNLFLAHLQNKREAEALKVLEQAAKQPHPDEDYLLGLAELYVNYMVQVPAQRQKVGARALETLDRAAKLKTKDPATLLRLAEDYSAAGNPTKAAQIYLALLKNLPEDSAVRERVHAKLASIYLRSSDPQKAAEQLQAIVRDDPTNPQAYFYLGFLAYEDKKPAQAAEYLKKTLLLRPDFEEAYYQLALAQLSLNQPDEALATLEKARQKFQQNFALELWTGLACARKKAYADAIKHFTVAEVIAKATDPTRLNEEFYFQLGAAYERTGDLTQAEKYFDKCLQLAPNSAEAQNYLGYMWAEHGIKLDKARELIEKAVKTEPKNAAYLDSLGWVLFKLNQPQDALGYILKAVELSSEPDATLYDHLGDIYAALKQPEKAREAWTKSLSLEPNEAIRKKVQPDTAP